MSEDRNRGAEISNILNPKEPQRFNRNFYSDDPAAGFADLVPVRDNKGKIVGYDTKLVNTTLPDGSDVYANFWPLQRGILQLHTIFCGMVYQERFSGC